jgi:hypothetical protein
MTTSVLPLRAGVVAPRRSRIPAAAAAGALIALLLLAAVVGSFASSGLLAGGGGCQSAPTISSAPGLAAGGLTVIATTYGGPGDPTSTHYGAANPVTGQSADLSGKMAWAELGAPPSASATFAEAHRLGDLLAGTPPPQTVGGDAGHAKPLPYGFPLKITSPASRSVVAYKLDIGAGAPGAAIDIWYDTALALNLPGAAAGGYKGPVRIAKAPPGTRPYPGTNPSTAAAGLPSSGAASGQACAATRLAPAGAGIDPIPGFVIGRDDMGVDATAPVGSPIYAPLASRLVEIVPGWYLGQPLLLFQFLRPPAGALAPYWYVAEQITPASTTTGTVFQAHQVVARFAPSGTGIEIGWGSPTSNARTLAAVTDPGAANPPAGATTPWGESFKRFFHIA